jgi:pilus assembly protein CpaB
MKWSVVALIFVGLISALCAAVLAAAVRAGGFDALTKPKEDETEIEVVVAAKDLPAMTVIEADAVTTKIIASEEKTETYYTNPLQVIGKVLSVPVVSGQVFTQKNFAADGSGIQLASALENGMRAVSISLTDYSGLYGLLYPGSVVDILATFKEGAERGQRSDAISITLLRGVQVLGIEDQTVVSAPEEEGESKGSKGSRGAYHRGRRWMVTLMVSSAEAQALQLAMEHGTVSLAMRNPLDSTATVDSGPTSLNRLIKNPGDELPKSLGRLAKLFNGVTARKGATSRASLEFDEDELSNMWQMEVYRGGKATTVALPVSNPEDVEAVEAVDSVQ